MTVLSLLQEIKRLHNIRRVVGWDTEFSIKDAGHPSPICLVAEDFETGEKRVQWYADGTRPTVLPFETDEHTAWVAYYAAAEHRTVIALGLKPPETNICLFAEHRVQTNGIYLPHGNGLVGALVCRGLPTVDADWKVSMQRAAIETREYDAAGQQAMLDYCASDVAQTRLLLMSMLAKMDWQQACLRGRYMKAVARMEANGIPIDRPVYDELENRWDDARDKLVAYVDRGFDVFDGTTLKEERLRRLVKQKGWIWPRHESGGLKLDDDTFKDLALRYPELEPLRQLRKTLGSTGMLGLPIGRDNRSRASLSPFRSKTSRNQPPSSKHLFGKGKWMRSFAKSETGRALAQLDWQSQEIGIAAGLSRDPRLIEGYQAGDPYLAFAKDAGLAPADATKESHTELRNVCKAVCLGLNYGLGARQLALNIGCSEAEARELTQRHKRAYPDFWRWNGSFVETAILRGDMHSVFGWRAALAKNQRLTSVMNFPMQANGAEMMRLAAIQATEIGIEVCTPVHDAFLVHLPAKGCDEWLAAMSETMAKASEIVTGGLRLRTDVKVFPSSTRYVDAGGRGMWNLIMRLAGMFGAQVSGDTDTTVTSALHRSI